MHASQASLRKAAILIASLDRETANDLLEQMEPAHAERVSDAVRLLGEIDPDEQNQVIREFRGTSRYIQPKMSGGVELDINFDRGVTQQASSKVGASTASNATTPFRFLHDAECAVLAPILEREHPQTIAVVAAHLPPSRAAELLASLPADLQVEVIRRLTDLDETDPAIIREIENSLERWVTEQTRDRQRRQAGMQTVAAILQAAQLNQAGNLLANLSNHKSSPLKQSLVEPVESEPLVEPEEENAFVFEDLALVSDATLVAVLQAADPNVATLALAGSTPELVERFTRHLSHQQSRQLRRALTKLGPTQLTDIEEAQNELARLAERLEREGRISIVPKRRLTMSA